MPDASAITRLRLASATVAGNRNSNRASSLRGSIQKKLEIYGNAYATGGGGGGGSDVGAYINHVCNTCSSSDPPPTGYLNPNGSFTYTSSLGTIFVYTSFQIFKIIAGGTPSITGRAIYYNPLTSGVTYTVTISPFTYTLPPGRFIEND